MCKMRLVHKMEFRVKQSLWLGRFLGGRGGGGGHPAIKFERLDSY